MQPTSLSTSSPERDSGRSGGRRVGYHYRLGLSTVKYLLHTEVHTFAFSVAANAILSFFPFVLLLMTLVVRVFHSPSMRSVIVELLRDYLPAGQSGQDFVIRNLSALASARNRVQVFSFVILLVTSTGVFMPLEVALNRVWRFPKNRSYFGNQLISLGLAFACGILALISIALSAGNTILLRFLAFGHDIFLVHVLGFMTAKVFATLTSMAIFFLIYWLLPNGKVLVAGGYSGPYLASAEVYDPGTGKWTATGSLASPPTGAGRSRSRAGAPRARRWLAPRAA